jgi:hypothetical protein
VLPTENGLAATAPGVTTYGAITLMDDDDDKARSGE